MNDKELQSAMRNLRAAQTMIQERPYGRKSRISKSDYGARSETSRYRAQKVADQTLTETKMTFEQQVGLLVEARQVSDAERVRKNTYAIPTLKGLYLK